MAGNLHVRNLDDDLIARLKRRAARHGRSTEAEHREILHQALSGDVEPSFDTLAADLRKLTKRRKQTPSEVLLRKDVRSGEHARHRCQHRHQVGGPRGRYVGGVGTPAKSKIDRPRFAGRRVREYLLEKSQKG